MFFKKFLALALSLPICAAVSAQSNDADKAKAATAAPVVTASDSKPVASAPELKSAAVTINELAAKQANALAASANKEVSTPGSAMPSPIGQMQPKPVPELKPEQAIGLTTDRDVKPFQLAKPPPPPKPYLAAVIGLKGKEIAEVQTSPNSSITVKAGDSIKGWSVEKIVGSQLYLAKSEVVAAKKKKTTVNRQYIWMVGEFLN